MSTPRPSTQCFAGNHSECTETMDTCNCTYRGGHKTSHAYANMEGVAAPLEPSPPINTFFRKHLAWHEKKLLPWQENVIIVAEAYAAAVSKNLQEELAASQRKVRKYKRYFCDKDTCSPLLDSCESETTCCLPCHLDTAEQKVAELQGEIATLELRRKEDADWINKTSQDEAKSFASRCLGIMAYSAGMSLRGEIAALRETKP